MARILLGWELGSGLGHVANLLPVARALAEIGHEPVLVLRDVVGAWPLLRDTRFTVFPAPVFFERPHFPASGCRSYADFLASLGYDDPEILEPMVRAWQQLVETIRPQLVVAEHAPTLCLTCCGRIPVINLGSGFTVPCEQDGLFPVLNPDASELVPLDRVRGTIGNVLRRLGQVPPNPVIQAVLGDESLSIVVAEIDPYRKSRAQPALGPLWPMPPAPPLPDAPACLIYLPADHPRLQSLLAGLVELPLPGIAYVRDATPQIIDWLRATPLEIATSPLDLDVLFPGISVVLHHGGVGISQRCLASGRPQVIVPIYFEQELNCTAMQELGVAIRLGAVLNPAKSGLALERAAHTPKLRQMAQRQAHAMQARYVQGSLDAVVKSCLAHLQPHSFKPLTHAAERTPVHLIHSFENPNGGSEQRTLHLYRLLRGHADVNLWCEYEPHPALLAAAPIRRIGPDGVPGDGTLVFVSTYYRVGAWFDSARPQRLIILYNIDAPATLNAWLERVAKPWFPKPELVFASHALSQRTGLVGTVQGSPIDLARFICARDYVRSENAPCTVGRLSRDTPDKHHPEDIALYRTLAERGYRVRIMGGTILHEALADVPGIELLTEGAEPAEMFLGSLDIFLYRTNENWFEASGRVVFEAMANGLPVVCHARGGYAEEIRHGENGFLYQSQEQAIAIIDTLRADPMMRAAIGSTAQREMQTMFGTGFEQGLREYYISRDQATVSDSAQAPDTTCAMTVFFAADITFVPVLETALFSLFQHNQRHRLTVHLALTGVSEDRCARFKFIARHFDAKLICHEVDAAALPPLPTDARIPMAAYFRLLIPQLVGEQTGRILYLDCDLLVTADLGPLWTTDLGGAVLAAVHDPGADQTRRTALGLSVGHSYFNSGVLLIDLHAWRRERVTEEALDFLSRFPGRAAYHDQDALNACLDSRVAILGTHWNFMPYLEGTREHPEYAAIELGQDFPKIVHYAGRHKPWTATACDDRWAALFRAQQEALNSLPLPALASESGLPGETASVSKSGKISTRSAQRFCVMTMGRSASTTLMAALEAETDIALPNKDIYCPGNELLHPVDMSLYETYYSGRTGRPITTPPDLVEAFYVCHADANFAGFKSFPSRHPDMASFSTHNDTRFVALLRHDLPSAVASFLMARAVSGQWARQGGPQTLHWQFDPELYARSVEAKIIEVVGECRALLQIPNAIRLTYEQLCGPNFSSAALDALFERPIRIANPRPPTHAADYVDNWDEFSAFVQATADRVDPRIRVDLDVYAAER